MSKPQTTDTVLMVAPVSARSNPQTSDDNLFQVDLNKKPSDKEKELIKVEFNNYVDLLKQAGVNVVVFEPEDSLDTPDAHFPNNWFSTHRDGTCILYPMMAENRRLERRPEIIEYLTDRYNNIIDLTNYENSGKFLEATGSMVLDRVNRISYAALSNRTDMSLLKEWARTLDYKLVTFTAFEGNGQPIYHTNVMASIGIKFAYICLEAIEDSSERKSVRRVIA